MKKKILDYCKKKVELSMQEIKLTLKYLQVDANNNSKSSMGDKYETGRAMVHLEQENLSKRYYDLELQYKVLLGLTLSKRETVHLGSLVKTESSTYYLSVGLGEIRVDSEVIFAVAPTSPIGQSMIGKKVGDVFTFNQNHFTIRSIE